MTATFALHPDDEKQLVRIRRYLIGFRKTEGWNQKEMSIRINGTEGMGWDLEYNQTWQWRFSRLQAWVAAFDLRLTAELRFDDDPDLECRVREHPEVAPLIGLSHTGQNWPMWQRAALTSSLAVARKEKGITSEQLAATLGITRKAVNNWEGMANEVLLTKLLFHARALGGRIQLGLDELDALVAR